MDNKQIIYHIFHADVTFHNFGFISNYIQYFGKQNFFIISSCGNKKLYDKYFFFFTEIHFNQFLILDNDISDAPPKVKYFIKKKRVFPLEYKLYSYILSNRDNIYLLHGDFFSTFGKLFLIFRGIKINYVCWGIDVESTKSLYMKIRNKVLFKVYSNIVCLMEPELNILNNFITSKQTIRKISYFNTLYSFILIESETNKKNTSFSRLLMGNSGRCIREYDLFFSNFDFDINQVRIGCMLNYGASVSEIDSFELKWAKYIESDKLILFKTILTQEDYIKMINSYDVYISPVNSQSGLGAIYTCMLLGKKLYLTGKNYEYISGLGCVVSKLEYLENDILLNDIYLNEVDKNINIQITNKLLNIDFIVQEWGLFFNKISVKL